MSGIKPKPLMPLFLTLVAAGVFLVGAALIPFLVREQEGALDGVGIIRQPVIMDQVAPKLALSDLQGKPASLGEALGKVVLVNNWATWCPPCQAEIPELEAFYQAHRNQNFDLIAIESGDPAEVVTKYVRQLGATFQVWLDPYGASLDSFHNWDLPNSYVIDQHGTIRLNWTGPVNQATLEKFVTPLLER